MNIKFCMVTFTVLAVCFQMTVRMATGSEVDPYPTLVLPVYQGADDNLIEYRRIMVEKKQAIDGIIRRVNETW